MAKTRVRICEHYVCAYVTCQKGHDDALLAGRCQTCKEYRPRKTGNPVSETVKQKRDKAAKKDSAARIKDYYKL